MMRMSHNTSLKLEEAITAVGDFMESIVRLLRESHGCKTKHLSTVAINALPPVGFTCMP